MAGGSVDVAERRRRAADVAAGLPRDGDSVGLGTGRTAALVVEALAVRAARERARFVCVATSRATEDLARARGLLVLPVEEVDALDIALDGADEVDVALDLVKGLGGALVRERLVERLAARLVIVVDDEKLVDPLGRGTIPVEVVPFGAPATAVRLEALGARAKSRVAPGGERWRSENGNVLYDLTLEPATRERLRTPEGKRSLAERIKALPGVVDHGLFVGMATELVVGNADGSVSRRSRA